MALSLLASTGANAEASQIIGTVNSLINQINAAGPAGGGNLNTAITIPVVSSVVNLLSITAGATGAPVVLSVGGPSAGSNVDIGLVGAGTGSVFLGGAAKAAADVIIVPNASGVNALQITGGASGSPVQLTIGGASADASGTLAIFADGLGSLALGGLGTLLGSALLIPSATSVVNGFQMVAAATSVSPTLSAVGSDTNIDIILNPKGSGVFRFNNATTFTAVGANACTMTALLPASAISSTVSKWLTVKDSSGGVFWIPAFH
jgi:hypothetical protein